MTGLAPSAPARSEANPNVGTLEARGIVRTFGVLRALDGLDFRLEAGSFLALFGPNGAGKSTLLKILSGALAVSEGELLEGDVPLKTRTPEWQARIGVLSHQTFLYPQLSAAENLTFFGRMYGLSDLRDRVEAGLASVGLAGRMHDPAGTYSRGMRQRLALARTLLHDPAVVLLDEPFTGLDAHASAVLRGVLEALRDGSRTVVMVTHALTEGMRMADTIGIQVAGRMAWWGRPDDIRDDLEVFYRRTVEGVSP